MRAPLPLVGLAVLALACSGGRAPDVREHEDTRAADVGVEEQALRSLRESHSSAIAARNADSIAAIYAEDVQYLAHGEKPQTGRNAARDAWERGFKGGELKLEYRPDDLVVAASGDLAYERGTVWSNLADPKSTKPTADLREGGNYLYLWRKEGGQWKVKTWMWNWHADS